MVEGVGGWAVPINESQTMADVAQALNLPIILVAGIRLGCLNHTLLTYAAIEAKGCQSAGWIANSLSEKSPVAEQNIQYLKHALPIPYLGAIPYLEAGAYSGGDHTIHGKVPLNISLLDL